MASVVLNTIFSFLLIWFHSCGKESDDRLCAKIVAYTDLYETDKEVQNLIDWVCLSEQIKENNNTIHNLTGEYKKIEPDCREGVRVQLEHMKELCKDMPYLFVKSWLPKTKINRTGTRSADNSANHVFFISFYLVQFCTSEKVYKGIMG